MMRARVHFNLRTHLWSVTAMEGPNKGRVVAHVERYALRDCRFVVSEASRQRVLATRRRAVHAWVEGFIMPAPKTVPAGAREFTYNPYRGGSFTLRGSIAPILSAKKAWFVGTKAYV